VLLSKGSTLLLASRALLQRGEGLVILRALDALNEVAMFCHPPSSQRPWRCIVVVQTTRLEERFEMLGRLDCVIAGQRGENMMAYMRRANVVMEPVKEGVGSVNGAQRSLDPSPV